MQKDVVTLKEINKAYPTETYFLSATKNIKKPLKVVNLRYAEHEDRTNRIKEMQSKVIELYNEHFNKFALKYEEVKFSSYSFLAENENRVMKLKEEIEYLQSLPKDVINSEGGVIYCGENNVWAEKVIINN
jgi:hypothetical protein